MRGQTQLLATSPSPLDTGPRPPRPAPLRIRAASIHSISDLRETHTQHTEHADSLGTDVSLRKSMADSEPKPISLQDTFHQGLRSGVLDPRPSEHRSVVSSSLRPHGLHSPWNSPGQNTGVSSLSLLQEIFPTLESNPGLLHCKQILYQLSHKGSPRILEWVAYRFSSGSSRPKNRIGVSCIAGEFFTN